MDRALLLLSGAAAKILDSAEDAIISVDDEQRIVLFNQGAENIFGYSSNEMTGQALDVLLPERFAGAHRQNIEDFAKLPFTSRRSGLRDEIVGRRQDGTEFPAEASISKVDVNGETIFTVILRDVTQRLAADQKTRASLRDTEALLKEIHHRVKNNLQVVSSLLGLQSRAVPDPETRKMFFESQNRIYSMALLHESLYHSESLSQVDFPEYVRQLADYLFQSYGGESNGRIRLRMDLERFSLHLDAAVPCGLIINELVSNSLKYAFPDGREGEIRIDLHGQPGGLAKLVVADDGVGLRGDVDWGTTQSLGLRLVRSLALQLGAKIEVNPHAGMEIQLLFSAAA